jgi:hypothetical protein
MPLHSIGCFLGLTNSSVTEKMQLSCLAHTVRNCRVDLFLNLVIMSAMKRKSPAIFDESQPNHERSAKVASMMRDASACCH